MDSASSLNSCAHKSAQGDITWRANPPVTGGYSREGITPGAAISPSGYIYRFALLDYIPPIPNLLLGNGPRHFDSAAALLAECSATLAAPRYEQVRTFRDWLVPTMKKRMR